ncbi:ATP-binding protein [Inhella sp.]|uniref:ATP-binding protein n=1 Tax=Inhella sp. TaxID=1921806 RepID=UPI0035B38A29
MPRRRRRLGLSLFWRTFAWLALLLAGVGLVWVITFRELEAEPRAVEAAHQLGDLVTLTRAALTDVEPIQRLVLLKSLEQRASIHVQVAEPKDFWEAYDQSAFAKRLALALSSRLGADTVVARSVNGAPGLWVRFYTGRDAYWLRTQAEPAASLPRPRAWWLALVLGATLLGSAVIAGLINRPLVELSEAANRIGEGEYDSHLNEHTLTSEIRDVNRGFNRMARVLAKLEQDRSVMLAGISHDLRTPLARLRLEAEMSVEDDMARNAMAQDIDQLDAIITKFMDYARPTELQLQPLQLSELVDHEARLFRNTDEIRIRHHVPATLIVMGDPTELGRVLQNVFENARRYGHAPGEPARVEVIAQARGTEVELTMRDHGPGVPDAVIAELTKPFYRGDAARTAVTGSGLGLAIVEKALQRMGGQLEISNAQDGGLITRIRLQRASV